MISRQHIAQWRIDHPWPFDDQVEQDLLLELAMCAVANDPLLSRELVLRGGTAFHKLFLDQPLRYSEDLDYVRTSEGGIGDVMKALTALGCDLGFEVRTKMGMYPKVLWRFVSESGTGMKIKIEINTYERSPMLGFQSVPLVVDSSYCRTSAEIRTYQVEELVASKLRALYQRSKGRDLYDLWLALEIVGVSPDCVLEAYAAYAPENVTVKMFLDNIAQKLEDEQFRSDMKNLSRREAPVFDVDDAARVVVDRLIRRL